MVSSFMLHALFCVVMYFFPCYKICNLVVVVVSFNLTSFESFSVRIGDVTILRKGRSDLISDGETGM